MANKWGKPHWICNIWNRFLKLKSSKLHRQNVIDGHFHHRKKSYSVYWILLINVASSKRAYSRFLMGFSFASPTFFDRPQFLNSKLFARYRNSLSLLILSLNFQMHALTERNADGNFKISHEPKIKKPCTQYKHLFNSFAMRRGLFIFGVVLISFFLALQSQVKSKSNSFVSRTLLTCDTAAANSLLLPLFRFVNLLIHCMIVCILLYVRMLKSGLFGCARAH